MNGDSLKIFRNLNSSDRSTIVISEKTKPSEQKKHPTKVGCPVRSAIDFQEKIQKRVDSKYP